MQYGQALDRLIREVVYADPVLGYIYMLKADVSNRFYRIGLRPEYAPKLGLIFPNGEEEDPMVATPSHCLWDGRISHLYSARQQKR